MTWQVTISGEDGPVFDCADGQDIVAAALGAGIELPYSCRSGVCGNCAAALTAGSARAAGAAPLHNDSTTAGQVLLCAATPTSDVRIAPLSWRRIDPQASKRMALRVFRNQPLAPDVNLLQLRLPAGRRAKFRAGQYLRIHLPDGSSRCYSMANPPHESDAFTLHVRRLPGGRFSGLLPQLDRGQTLEVEWPFGNVELPPDSLRPIVFVAGGTGFAPIKSLLDDLARRRVMRPITLIWAAREASGLYLLAALAPWRRQWPGLRFIAALSEQRLEQLPGEPATPVFHGRADQALAVCCGSLAGSEVYCCGSPAMVAAVRTAALGACGLATADFHADVFVDGAR